MTKMKFTAAFLVVGLLSTVAEAADQHSSAAAGITGTGNTDAASATHAHAAVKNNLRRRTQQNNKDKNKNNKNKKEDEAAAAAAAAEAAAAEEAAAAAAAAAETETEAAEPAEEQENVSQLQCFPKDNRGAAACESPFYNNIPCCPGLECVPNSGCFPPKREEGDACNYGIGGGCDGEGCCDGAQGLVCDASTGKYSAGTWQQGLGECVKVGQGCPRGYSGLFPTDDCTGFVFCQNGNIQGLPRDCPEAGTLFDTGSQICLPAAEVNCAPPQLGNMEPTSNNSEAADSDTNGNTEEETQETEDRPAYKCPTPPFKGFYPVEDCTAFIYCNDGTTNPRAPPSPCSEGRIFDFFEQLCKPTDEAECVDPVAEAEAAEAEKARKKAEKAKAEAAAKAQAAAEQAQAQKEALAEKAAAEAAAAEEAAAQAQAESLGVSVEDVAEYEASVAAAEEAAAQAQAAQDAALAEAEAEAQAQANAQAAQNQATPEPADNSQNPDANDGGDEQMESCGGSKCPETQCCATLSERRFCIDKSYGQSKVYCADGSMTINKGG